MLEVGDHVRVLWGKTEWTSTPWSGLQEYGKVIKISSDLGSRASKIPSVEVHLHGGMAVNVTKHELSLVSKEEYDAAGLIDA